MKFALFLVLIISWAVTHYIVPQTDIVRAVGVETKRVDLNGSTVTETGLPTRDVYFVQTEQIDDQSPMVYRNEDNIFYAKWNSADIQARAQSLAADKDIVTVRHYGWRIPFLSFFPNSLGIKPADEGQSGTPYLFYIVLALVWGGIFWVYRKITGFGRRRAERREAARDTEHDSRDNDRPGGNSDLFDFFNDD